MLLCVDISKIDWNIVLNISSLVVAIATLIVAIITVIVAKKIDRQQVSREVNKYLLSSIVASYNLLEADAMLLAQGTLDDKISKDEIDKEALFSISKAKSYSLMIDNMGLFDYLDSLITGKTDENLGQFIDDYFTERNNICSLVKKSRLKNPQKLEDFIINNGGEKIRDDFLARARILRTNTIEKINSLLKNSNKGNVVTGKGGLFGMMKDKYYEKANFKLKEKCKKFAKKHQNDMGDHSIFSKALKLTGKLIKSLLYSQREFNWRIRCEIKEIDSAQSELAKDLAILRFNQKNIVLVLDDDAKNVLLDMQKIMDNNQ